MSRSKRINLVFNLDRDYEVYHCINSRRNKSAYVKEAVLYYEGLREFQVDRSTLKELIKEALREVTVQMPPFEKNIPTSISDDIFDAISNL